MLSTLTGADTEVETLSLSVVLPAPNVTRMTVTGLRRDLDLLSELVVMADYVASPKPQDPLELARAGLPGRPIDLWISRTVGKVEILRLSYESPLEIALVVAPSVAASVSALATLIYAIKRLYGVDLEFRTYREERRAEYLAAKDLARRLDQSSKVTLQQDDPFQDAVQIIDDKSGAGRIRRAQDAILSDDDCSIHD